MTLSNEINQELKNLGSIHFDSSSIDVSEKKYKLQIAGYKVTQKTSEATGALVSQLEVVESQDGSSVALKYLNKNNFVDGIGLGSEITLKKINLFSVRDEVLSNEEFLKSHNFITLNSGNSNDFDKNFRVQCTGSFYDSDTSTLYCVNLDGKVYKYKQESLDPIVNINSQNL
jgi:hypothetical protein